MNSPTEQDVTSQILTTPSVPDMTGDAILTALVNTIRAYVVLSWEQAIALALWTIHTWAFDAAVTTPYIVINSAAKRSGKTTLLEVLELFVRDPWLTGRVSAAVLVRKTDKERPTLLLDESDAAFQGERDYAEALRGILNTGFKASGKASLCVREGANISYKDFHTFSPKAIAGIGKLPDTVMDRAIVVTLKRRARSETVKRFRSSKVREQVEPLRSWIAGWATASLSALRGREPELPDALNDRAQDVWEPLLAIADEAGGSWPQLARTAAIVLSGGNTEDDDVAVQLLGDCRVVFDEADNPEVMPSKDLVEKLAAMEDRPWGTWSQGRPITQAKVAHILAGFGIVSHVIRIGAKTPRGYTLTKFIDAWERYLPSPEPTKAQQRNEPNRVGRESPFSEVQQNQDVAHSITQQTSIHMGSCCAVALSEPNPEADDDNDPTLERVDI